MLKSIGPSTDPWGTSRANSDQLLKLELSSLPTITSVTFINFKESFENPEAFNLAIRIMLLIVSKAFERPVGTELQLHNCTTR